MPSFLVRSCCTLALFVILVASVPSGAPAQQPHEVATLNGIVRTAAGIPVGGAIVRIAGSRSVARTDSLGCFELSGVPIGVWMVRVESRDFPVKNVPVEVARRDNSRLEIQLAASRITSEHEGSWGMRDAIRSAPLFIPRLAKDCATIDAGLFSHATVFRVDSTRTWGSFSLAIDPLHAGSLRVGCAPARSLPELTVHVANATGRVVRVLRTGPASGPETLAWEGRDDDGRALPAGWFVVRFGTGRDSVAIDCCAIYTHDWPYTSPLDSPLELPKRAGTNP